MYARQSGSWVLLACLLIGAPSASAQEADALEVPEPPAQTAPPEWRWTQVLAAPRIGARLTAVAMDPTNPNRIYVGSQSGVVFFSGDGGITWRELQPHAYTANRRDVLPPNTDASREPGGVGTGSVRGRISCVSPDCDEIPLTFQFTGNPVRPPTGSATSLILRQLPSIARGTTFPRGTFLPTYRVDDVGVPRDLLGNALRSRRTEEVRRIVICPGSPFPIVVATRREVVASPDHGNAWVRLLRFSGAIETPQIACDPLNTDHLIIATQAGYQESLDGGITIDPNLAGYPRGAVEAVSFGTDGSLYLASGYQLFKRDLDEVDARRIYPDFNSSQTAPWEPILWIEPEGDEVWLATQDGLRHSEQHGQQFRLIAPNLFSRQVIPQVVVGRSESGGTRVAAILRDCPRNARTPTSAGCRGTLVLSSDDGGETWHPFFQGMTRRSIQQMAAAGDRWLIVTGGELWMTSRATPGAVDQAVVRQARRDLERSPSLSTTVELALEHMLLNQDQVNDLVGRGYAQGWVPRRVSVHFELDLDALAQGQSRTGEASSGVPGTFFRDFAGQDAFFYLWGFVEWDLGHLGVIDDRRVDLQEPNLRRDLYALRREISFLVEDAWHERQLHLRRLARGFADPYQAAVIEERIDVLDAILEFYMGRPLEEVEPRPRRRR
jgi:hypothetical protein